MKRDNSTVLDIFGIKPARKKDKPPKGKKIKRHSSKMNRTKKKKITTKKIVRPRSELGSLPPIDAKNKKAIPKQLGPLFAKSENHMSDNSISKLTYQI
jgi:hypothetical protein